MRAVEIEADSVDAAVAQGLHQLGATEQDVRITVLDPGAHGILGLGARKARVRLELVYHPAAAATDTVAPNAAALPGESLERVRQVLEELFRLLDVPVQIEVTRAPDQVVFYLTGTAAGFVIGKRGQMLDALEYIANRIAVRDDSHAQHITLDVEGYRERRRLYLEGLAKRLAAQVKRKRKPIELEPMSPRDRRTVHLTLQGDPALTTHSTGEGYYRRLVISLKQTNRS